MAERCSFCGATSGPFSKVGMARMYPEPGAGLAGATSPGGEALIIQRQTQGHQADP